jgi:hypothetical protein
MRQEHNGFGAEPRPSANCGDCNSFGEYVLRYHRSLLERHGFTFVQCSAEREGRECVVMYAAQRCKLLFVLSDGAEACAIGAADLPFPVEGWLGTDGDGGWYSVIGLIEFVSDKKLLTRQLIDEFLGGERVYFEWESALLGKWIDRLSDMFEPSNLHTWIGTYTDYMKTRRYA